MRSIQGWRLGGRRVRAGSRPSRRPPGAEQRLGFRPRLRRLQPRREDVALRVRALEFCGSALARIVETSRSRVWQ